MITIKNLNFSYDRPILKNVSFELKKGQFLGIVGKSGGGKSSLLKIIGGYLSPESGSVVFNGKKMIDPKYMLIPGFPEIAFVHQDFGLNLYHTVRQNIREKIAYLPQRFQEKLIHEILELLDLKTLVTQKAIELSGGEQQRLSIARALVSETDLIIMDEPFVHLDAPIRVRLIRYLQQLREVRNTSFIIVTHNGDEILGLCDKVIYLKQGRISRKAKPTQFYTSPRSIEEAEFFGQINSINRNGKRKLFRPNQYALESTKNNQKLDVLFTHAIPYGPLVHNFFTTERGERIVLFNFEEMESISRVYV